MELIKFYKKDELWVLGAFDPYPAGNCICEINPETEWIAIRATNSPQAPAAIVIQGLPTSFCGEDGIAYASLDAFKAGTRDFFVNATSGGVAELESRIKAIEQSEFGAIAEALHAYGVQIDNTKSSPILTRIGNVTKQKTTPVQSKMKGCLLLDDGTVNYYLNPTTWSKKADGTDSKLDGTHGNVMVEIPEFYYKATTLSANIYDLQISEIPILGYTLVPKQYAGSYKATIARDTLKMSSVMSMDANYRGGNNNAELDLLSASQLGIPASSINLTNFRTYARNRGARFSPIYYDLRKWLYWLFVIEYANLNSQAPVQGKDPITGFMTGGLGDGFTTASSAEWSAFNGSYPVCKCGTTNSLGNGSGEVNFTVNDFGGVGVHRTFKANRYRGIENPFGDIWEWTDGILMDITETESKMYTTSDPSKFSSDSFANYTDRGNTARTNGYIKTMKLGANADIIPIEIGGGATTYFGDNYSQSITPGLRGVFFGGDANRGASAGFVCASTYYAPSTANTYIGSRLCFV